MPRKSTSQFLSLVLLVLLVLLLQAGEVVEFLVDEGAPVEYKQAVLVIAPYFGECDSRRSSSSSVGTR